VFARSEGRVEPRLGRFFMEIQGDSMENPNTSWNRVRRPRRTRIPPGSHIRCVPKQGGDVVPSPCAGCLRMQCIALSNSVGTRDVRAAPSDRGGNNVGRPVQRLTDPSGALHLRIAGGPGN
jgi:hypothetical protein